MSCVYPAGIYLLKVNNRNTRTRYEICSKLAIKTPKRRRCHRRMNNQIYISQLSTSLISYKVIFDFKNIVVRLSSKFILIFFDSVYSTRSSETVTKYTIYTPPPPPPPPRMVLGLILLTKHGLKIPCILLSEKEYSLEFVSKNPPFLSRPSEAKIEIAIIWW